jgi:fibronectin type 3 domain-containing protein
LLLAGCGYVGDPLPPPLNIPQPVTDLRALQRGDRIEIAFTIPPLTTDGLGLRLGDVDLRAAPSDPGADLDAWAAAADRFAVKADAPGPVVHRVPITPWLNKPLWIAVRVASHKRRWSAWSSPVSLDVIAEVRPPRELTAEAVAEGVRLQWSFPEEREGRRVRVFRKGHGEEAFTEAAVADGSGWTDDASAQFGLTYDYAVEAIVGQAHSLRTAPVRVTREDRFPPARPAGLRAVAAVGVVELTWDRNPEQDLAGYRVYRALGDGAYGLIAGPVAAPGYSDREVKGGVKYRYAVGAVDRNGNESPPSEPTEVETPPGDVIIAR